MKKINTNSSNRSGTLEKRKNGYYYARWVVDGHRYTKSTGTTNKAEAEKKLAELVKPFQNNEETANQY